MRITLLHNESTNLQESLNLCPQKDWQKYLGQERWIIQTYKYLKEVGLDIYISQQIPNHGVLIFHARYEESVYQRITYTQQKNLTLIAIRADKPRSFLADIELVQNSKWHNDRNRFFIPYWPQPGIIPRDHRRNTRVENIGFKGFEINMRQFFRSKQWINWIEKNDLFWIPSSMHYKDSVENGILTDWHDYSKTDVIIAMRPMSKETDQGFPSKPATKLYNAWHAGVPAVLAPEYAYRELRQSGLDYIEIKQPIDAQKAILRLKKNPSLYQDMVENGRERAKEFTKDIIVKKWEDFLTSTLPQRHTSKALRYSKIFPLQMKRNIRLLRMHVLKENIK